MVNHDSKIREGVEGEEMGGGRLDENTLCACIKPQSIRTNKQTNKMASVWSRVRVEPEVVYVYNPSI